MFQDYKLAHSEEGDTYKEEAQSAVTVGRSLKSVQRGAAQVVGSNHPTRSIFSYEGNKA